MLKRLGERTIDPSVKITEAKFPVPFSSGLEYGAPARGTWNIVHVGMLIPEAHQIFVCAQGCLRGVVLTAAEMGASERFSTITIREHNILEGDMEQLILDGVEDLLERLPKKPPAILLYTSCIHHFMGCDLKYVYKQLEQRYLEVQFADCYMNPIMRKSGMTPDQIMRRQLYRLLKPSGRDYEEQRLMYDKYIHFAGNDFSLHPESELYEVLSANGYTIFQVASCRTYEEYQELANCAYCITTAPAAKSSGVFLEKEYNQKHLYLPSSFCYETIERNLHTLADVLQITIKKEYFEEQKALAESALKEAKKVIGDTKIVIDYTAYPFMLSLAKLLITHGFLVTGLYADSFLEEEREIFNWLKENAPNLQILPTVHPAMRVRPRNHKEKILAIGQKAAYFQGTEHFVNLVEGKGHWGCEAIRHLSEELCEAYQNPKDTKKLIQIKGMGCGDCI